MGTLAPHVRQKQILAMITVLKMRWILATCFHVPLATKQVKAKLCVSQNVYTTIWYHSIDLDLLFPLESLKQQSKCLTSILGVNNTKILFRT